MKRLVDFWAHVARPLKEGTLCAVVIGGLLFATLFIHPTLESGWFLSPDFAARQGGGCAGWSPGVFWLHTINDLGTWWAYIVIAFALLRNHPILKNFPVATVAIYLAVAFFIGCGGKHLLDAYTNFRPIYWVSGFYGTYNLVASMFGGLFIAVALDQAFYEVRRRQATIDDLQKQLTAKQ